MPLMTIVILMIVMMMMIEVILMIIRSMYALINHNIEAINCTVVPPIVPTYLIDNSFPTRLPVEHSTAERHKWV